MNSKFENNELTIFLEGSVDSNNAEDVGKQIDDIRAQYPEGTLALDLENLRYISSAGLRQVLRLKKKEKDFKIVNVSNDVYEIFDMTGFAEMMDIQKGYRKMSVEGCEKIGEGSNGIVYRINPDTIIKVYKNNDALEDIKRERELAKTALILGVNTAIPFDIVKVGDKFGSVFELLSAKSITKLINADPDNKDKYIHIFVDLLKEIHRTTVKEGLLPDSKVRTLDWAEFLEKHIPSDKYEKLHKMIEAVPFDLHMIHGDYHANNVHYANGEAILIDMDTLATGNPVFEFSNIYLAYQGFGDLDKEAVSKFMNVPWETACYIYEKTFEFYFEDKGKEYIEEAKHKAQVVGYTRILRRTIKRDPDNKEAIEHYKKRLLEEIDLVNDLALEHA